MTLEFYPEMVFPKWLVMCGISVTLALMDLTIVSKYQLGGKNSIEHISDHISAGRDTHIDDLGCIDWSLWVKSSNWERSRSETSTGGKRAAERRIFICNSISSSVNNDELAAKSFWLKTTSILVVVDQLKKIWPWFFYVQSIYILQLILRFIMNPKSWDLEFLLIIQGWFILRSW